MTNKITAKGMVGVGDRFGSIHIYIKKTKKVKNVSNEEHGNSANSDRIDLGICPVVVAYSALSTYTV